MRHDVKSYVLEWNFVDAWVFFWNNEIHVTKTILRELNQKNVIMKSSASHIEVRNTLLLSSHREETITGGNLSLCKAFQ